MSDVQGRAVACVARLEIREIGREHLLAIEILLRRLGPRARLRHEEIEVHRERGTPRAADLERRKIEAPQTIDLLGPRIGRADAARVIAEAARLQRSIEAGPRRKIRRAEALHATRIER